MRTYYNFTEVLNLYKVIEVSGTFEKKVYPLLSNYFDYDYCLAINEYEQDFKVEGMKKAFDICNWINTHCEIFNKEYELRMNPSIGTSKQVSRFNDTPQGSGDFSDDNHATNVTINENSGAIDSASAISILSNMIINEINDFRKEFIIYE